MPSRVVREGFVDSEAVCALNDWSHRVYSNLILKVDDAGRFDGRLEFIRSHLFPLGTDRRSNEVESALTDCEDHALLVRYHFAGKPYLQLTRWHRTGSSKESKFPWRDGSREIRYVALPTKDGPKEFVFSSVLNLNSTPSIPPTDALPRGPNTEYRTSNSEKRGSAEGEQPESPPEPDANAIEPPYRPPIAGHVFALLKAEIGKHFNRAPAQQWPYYEEHLLAGIARQPGAESDWLEILIHQKKTSYPKQSVKALLEDWAACLDAARRPKTTATKELSGADKMNLGKELDRALARRKVLRDGVEAHASMRPDAAAEVKKLNVRISEIKALLGVQV